MALIWDHVSGRNWKNIGECLQKHKGPRSGFGEGVKQKNKQIQPPMAVGVTELRLLVT